jgi:hypothetical protein
MTTEELRGTLHKAPFEPFTMHLADGHSIHVPHPDFVALRGLSAAIVTSPKSNAYAVVELTLVTRLEIPASQQRDK